MDYPGKELELFDKAYIFRKYLYYKVKKYIGKNILEVGAGIGSFTKLYLKENQKITLSELDSKNLAALNEKFDQKKNINIKNTLLLETKGQFDTIMYMSVLEHIKEDTLEIKNALDKLTPGGYLIIFVPAHNKLYNAFDKAIGHFKRYEKLYFQNFNVNENIDKKIFFIDAAGYVLYYLNKLFFKEEIYPSSIKIFIWDKLITPITIFIDFLTFYKIGKNIVCIIKKN